MTELIRQNAEQLRRVALENSKKKQNRNVKSVQSKIYNSNPFQDEYYNLSNIKKSNAHLPFYAVTAPNPWNNSRIVMVHENIIMYPWS